MRAFKLALDIDRLIPLRKESALEIAERIEIAMSREVLDAAQEREK